MYMLLITFFVAGLLQRAAKHYVANRYLEISRIVIICAALPVMDAGKPYDFYPLWLVFGYLLANNLGSVMLAYYPCAFFAFIYLHGSVDTGAVKQEPQLLTPYFKRQMKLILALFILPFIMHLSLIAILIL